MRIFIVSFLCAFASTAHAAGSAEAFNDPFAAWEQWDKADHSQAERLVEQAYQAAKAEDFDSARAKLDEAHKLSLAPSALANARAYVDNLQREQEARLAAEEAERQAATNTERPVRFCKPGRSGE